jgi:hypothetical protein
VLAEPQVAITAQASKGWLAANVYWPVDARSELVSGDPRAGSPLALTTAILASAAWPHASRHAASASASALIRAAIAG